MLQSSEQGNTTQKDEPKKINTPEKNPAPAMLRSSEPGNTFRTMSQRKQYKETRVPPRNAATQRGNLKTQIPC
jgi:hypothetical protein